jgi:hypothetical protein
MLLGAEPSDARRRTLVDAAEQARSINWVVPFETPAEQVRAGKTRVSKSRVSRMAQACEYGPK